MIPFRARHVPLIKPDVNEEWMDLALKAEDNGRGYTACLLGDPIGCAGISVHANHIGEAWALFSPLIKCLPLSLFRAVSKGMNEIIEEKKLTKVWSIVDPRDQAAVRFLQHLGFDTKMPKLLVTREVRWNG